MKRIIILLLISCVFTISLEGNAQKSFYVKVRQHTDAYTHYTGQTIPERDVDIEIWMSDKAVTFISGDNKFIVDLGNNLMILSNTKYKTFIKLTLPLDLKSHLNEYALLRYQTYWMRFYVYGLATGNVEESEETRYILGRECKGYEKNIESTAEYANFKSKATIWASADVPFDLEAFNKMNAYLQNFLEFNNSAKLNDELKKIKGFPFLEETSRTRGSMTIKTTSEVIELSSKTPPDDIYSVPPDYYQKDKISFDELVNGSIGPIKKELTADEKEVFAILKELKEGYIKRDVSIAQEWVKSIIAKDFHLVGTNATFPRSGEWLKGSEAAKIFESDFRYWGDVALYIDEAEISVEGDGAWVALFATVTRKPGMEPRYRDAETIRKTILNIINAKAEKDWSSKRILQEIIHDASWALVEYERSPEFIWPIRITANLVRREGKWLIKQMHWSFPGEGYPIVRLIRHENR
ncbi:MAG: hypothetical protein ACETWC_08895 [Acidobacteriota bacterium]